MALLLVDGFVKDEILLYIIQLLAKLEPGMLEVGILKKDGENVYTIRRG